MLQLRMNLPTLALCFGLAFGASTATAAPITGTMEATSPLGQYLALTMTITDETTTFELTGPDFSYFAFGFDTTTMQGYSLIVEGLDDNRTVVEQNLVGIGAPGSPQPVQNLTVLDILHDEPNDLTTLIIERANQTGDPDDPDFTTDLNSLNVIWAYASFATPESPYEFLDFHGREGRGFGTITFTPIPEPTTGLLILSLAGSGLMLRNRHPR